ncbi:Cell envelope-related transcriptional attenuator domain family [Synechococcus sp. PCC 7335]|uniref:LCP family protein n=1 Tax=Synechococcus sp. (strain ATCC 29403 / PCC 7335) TaxID=91464 RepID=UPI00017EC3A9|nr:LCP family protein [Synechococcus sp. PCC 7335]EDX86005.1 Cell envelope-related transcriptional attenuator domain family [Synechococcus sp. PCC 7335]
MTTQPQESKPQESKPQESKSNGAKQGAETQSSSADTSHTPGDNPGDTKRIQLPPTLDHENSKDTPKAEARVEAKVEASKQVSKQTVTPTTETKSTTSSIGQNTGQKPNQTSRFSVHRLLRNTLLGAAFVSTALVTASLGMIAVITFPLPRQVNGEAIAPPLSDLWRSGFRYQVSRPINILVMGLDEARDIEGADPEDLVGRTDTMLLVRVDPEADIVNVMSIPRDTRVEIPDYGFSKINEANAEGGAELAARTVSHNFSNVEIDRYIRVSTAAFKEIVDLVGGIEILVPKAMQYEDKTQGLVIDLDPGLQTLTGDQAEQFARFRQDAYGDIGRVQRQQVLLKALRRRLTNPTVLPKLPQIIRVLQKRIDTNLTVEELLALAGFGLDLEPQDMQMVMLPGRFSAPEEYLASYWLSDPLVNSEIMRTYFDADTIELVNDVDTNYYETPSDWALSNLSVAVQNATDERYASSSMAEYLREQGFFNVYVVPNWPKVERKTAVVVQRGDVGSAREIKSILDLGRVVSESTGDIDSDITIRVGEDWLEQIDPDWQRLPYDGPR